MKCLLLQTQDVELPQSASESGNGAVASSKCSSGPVKLEVRFETLLLLNFAYKQIDISIQQLVY